MDVFTILETVLRYGIAVLGIAGSAALLAALGYLFYKKALHGAWTLSFRSAAVLFLLLAWLLLVLFLTTFSRGANFTGEINLSLFSGYINAWNTWSFAEFQLILLNLLMFAPLGFLLPFLGKRARKFSVAGPVFLGTTLGIEVLQLCTGRGIFELDDLMHNFLGCLFGYFAALFALRCGETKRIHLPSLLRMLALPLCYGALALAAVVVYWAQPYGNLSFLPAQRQDLSRVTVEKDSGIACAAQEVPVYQNLCVGNTDYARQVSAAFADFLGIEWNRSARIDNFNTIFTDGEQQLTYSGKDGWWTYTNWREPASPTAEAAALWREKIEGWLQNQGLLSADAAFALQNGTTLRWDIDAPAAREDHLTGIVLASLDEAGELCELYCDVKRNRYVAQIRTVPEAEAYADIAAGNFALYTPFAPGDVLHITGCDLDFVYDTKGFTRPVYRYSGFVNAPDSPWSCLVSAA